MKLGGLNASPQDVFAARIGNAHMPKRLARRLQGRAVNLRTSRH